jgi:hypothetical protein
MLWQMRTLNALEYGFALMVNVSQIEQYCYGFFKKAFGSGQTIGETHGNSR